MRALRKLILGETWSLPAGVLVVLLAGLALRETAHGWWVDAGGFILLVLALVVLSAALAPAHKRR